MPINSIDGAKKKTNDVIEEILPHGSVNNMTRLMLANALEYILKEKFNASKTKDREFLLLNGVEVTL